MLSGMCIVLTSDCCHATLHVFHPVRIHYGMFNILTRSKPNQITQDRTATNGMLAQCLTIKIKIQICNLQSVVFLTFLFRIHHCSEECLQRTLTYVMKRVKVLRDLRRACFAKYRSVICQTEYI